MALAAPTNADAASVGARLLPVSVPVLHVCPDTVQDVQNLVVVRVTDDAQRAVWTPLLHHEHPRGTTSFCGARGRYLICSAPGYLGSVGLSAAAREHWMAWTDAQRQAHLGRVESLSRILMRGRC